MKNKLYYVCFHIPNVWQIMKGSAEEYFIHHIPYISEE